MKHITHIITGLGNGGAEMMLFKLLENIDRSKYNIKVISMMDKGIMGDKIEKLGVEVYCLNIKRGLGSFFNFSAINRAVNIIKDADIVQTWMYHADLFGLVTSKIAGVDKVIWGIRRANLDYKQNRKALIIIAKINAFLSRSKRVYRIISCSKKASEVHTRYGYKGDKIITIPNGFNLSMFKEIENSRMILEEELGLNGSDRIVCHVGRWNAMKDYQTLVKCIKLTLERNKDIKFVLCGTDIDESNYELKELIIENDIDLNRIYLLGRRDDIPIIMSASDILVLSSVGEGFPNVIGESMACKTPCVVTDVGDCAFIVDEYGKVVEKQNYVGLSDSILYMINMEKQDLNKLGADCRNRILNNFDIHNIVSMYEDLYK